MNTTAPVTETARRFDDLNIEQAVQAELAWTPDVRSPAIGVAVSDRVVTLTGEVGSLHERLAAVEATQRVAGVRTVADELHLPEVSGDPEGAALAASVDAVLAWTSGVPHEGIRAEIQGHTVILTGVVEWDYERHAAKKAVQALAGVHFVDNRIELTRRASAETVAEEIHNAIRRNAIVDANRVTVTANGGTVTLTGTVRSWTERAQAVRTAWSSPHVTDVHDRLDVVP